MSIEEVHIPEQVREENKTNILDESKKILFKLYSFVKFVAKYFITRTKTIAFKDKYPVKTKIAIQNNNV